MKPSPLVVAVREELKQAECARDPEFTVRSLKELEHPGGWHSLPSRKGLEDNRRSMRVIGCELEEPAVTRARPEPALMVFEQVVKEVVRQTVAFGVTRHATVRPASIQTAVRGNPQRAVSVFQ